MKCDTSRKGWMHSLQAPTDRVGVEIGAAFVARSGQRQTNCQHISRQGRKLFSFSHRTRDHIWLEFLVPRRHPTAKDDD